MVTSMPWSSRAARTTGSASCHHGSATGISGKAPTTAPSGVTSTSLAIRCGCAAAWSIVTLLMSFLNAFLRDAALAQPAASAFNTRRTGIVACLPTPSPDDSRASASPRDSAFYQDPYAFYSALHAGSPTFFWEDYGHWCFAGFKEVSALLRDKRFGRQILHVASREQLGLPEPKPHTAAFDRTEKYSLLNLEPPAHTRLRTLVNRAFVSRHVEQLRPRIERLANELIDGFAADGEVELLKAYAAPIPAIVIAEMIGLPAEMAAQLVDLVEPHGDHVHVRRHPRDRARRQPGVGRVHGLPRHASSPSGAGSRGKTCSPT